MGTASIRSVPATGICAMIHRMWNPTLAGLLPLAGLLLLPMLTGTALADRLDLAQISGEFVIRSIADERAPVREASEPGPSVAGGDRPEPRPVEMVQPDYPSRAERLTQDGRVMVCFTVDENGAVQDPVIVSSTDSLFNEPVLTAILRSRFEPALSDGYPVRSTACRTYRFIAPR